MELVSVIIPVYNVRKYIKECLDSIVRQTYDNIEIIVVDDGSTDGSSDICDEYLCDERVKVFHRNNSGLSASRQYGIDNCSGVYFCTIDSDDFVHENYIANMVATIVETESDICVCGRIDFEDDTKLFREVPIIAKRFKTSHILSSEELEVYYSDVCGELVLSDSWNKMYRTEFVRESNVKFNLNNEFNGTDLVFNHRLAMHCPKCVLLEQNLLYHRNLSGSRVHKKNEKLQDGFQTIIKMLGNEAELCGINLDVGIRERYFDLLDLVYLNIINFEQDRTKRKNELQIMIEKHISFGEEHKWACHVGKTSGGALRRTYIYCIVHNKLSLLNIITDIYLFLRRISRRFRKSEYVG